MRSHLRFKNKNIKTMQKSSKFIIIIIMTMKCNKIPYQFETIVISLEFIAKKRRYILSIWPYMEIDFILCDFGVMTRLHETSKIVE